MIENLTKLEEMLNQINGRLNSMETLFIGPKIKNEESVEEIRDNCIMDTITKNLQKADFALCTLEKIENVLRGGVK